MHLKLCTMLGMGRRAGCLAWDAGRMVAGMEGSIHSAEDVARLAAALTRASLPMHYHVNIGGEKAAS